MQERAVQEKNKTFDNFSQRIFGDKNEKEDSLNDNNISDSGSLKMRQSQNLKKKSDIDILKISKSEMEELESLFGKMEFVQIVVAMKLSRERLAANWRFCDYSRSGLVTLSDMFLSFKSFYAGNSIGKHILVSKMGSKLYRILKAKYEYQQRLTNLLSKFKQSVI